MLAWGRRGRAGYVHTHQSLHARRPHRTSLPLPRTRSDNLPSAPLHPPPARPTCLPAQVCEQRGLVRESVYVLGRMGSAEKALRLIVEGLRDVGQAVEFVQLQQRGDEELWGQLIALTLGDAQLTGAVVRVWGREGGGKLSV